MLLDDFDYNLPEELIAQYPSEKRDECRLLVADRKTGNISHRHFYDILEYLNPGDCLVLNDSRVIPARIFGVRKGTGARIEFLLIKRIKGDTWETMVRPGRKVRKGDVILFGLDADKYINLCDSKGSGRESDEMKLIEESALLRATVSGYGDDGTRTVDFEYDGIFMEILDTIGSMPLPPYIARESELEDREMYQTVYSRVDGSVAAPTAGLHFTEELLRKASDKGVDIAYVTLHVGIGTFRPVKVDRVEDHRMHFEEYSIDEKNAEIINRCINRGGRIVSVGTTSTRTVESAAFRGEDGKYYVRAGAGSTGIFIYPGYEFKVIDSLVTNFHLPKSTLLMLISALYSREDILRVYETAVKEKYRFFSYGDAMLII